MCKALVVDQAGFMRGIIKNILVQAGISDVYEASTGKQALTIFKEVKPDLLTTELRLPDLSGLALIQAVLRFKPGTKAIICSSEGGKDTVINAIKIGARQYLIKPLDADKTVKIIREIMQDGA
jgi:two-component system chemotaxis response regulator CheY